jgi:DNA-binding NarL/FixJ family response regulator
MKALLVDDHALFRSGLALLMSQSFDGIACLEAASLTEALALGAQHPDLALILFDLGLPDHRGVEGLHRLRAAVPAAGLVVLSADDSAATVQAALDAGAQGFIPKTAEPGSIRTALQRLLGRGLGPPSGQPGNAAEAVPALPDAEADADPAAALGMSDRQRDVLRLLVAGRSNKLIGRELALSESTVKTHLAVVFRKLQVNSRTQAVIKAARLGLNLGAPR